MIIILLLLPFTAGILALLIPSPQLRRILLPLIGIIDIILILLLWLGGEECSLGIWFGTDSINLLFMLITGVLFTVVSLPAILYLKDHPDTHHPRLLKEDFFIFFLLFFLGSMNAALMSQHVGIFWVAIEATTLMSAPLISYHITEKSLEATWKYLLICSVGIAMALLGNIALTMSLPGSGTGESQLTFSYLTLNASGLKPFWLKIAFAFLFVGYGTKTGLVPLHVWLPDAHSEAPSPVSALLSGALLNCAFTGILRMVIILEGASLEKYSSQLLIFFGILSLFTAGGMILHQFDYKRMLAYSSIEHMGILSLAMGSGAACRYGAFLHAINHSLAKCLLFLTAGMILTRTKTKKIQDIHGLIKTDRLIAIFWILGSLAIVGLPPFGTFVSEIEIMTGLGEGQHWILLGLLLITLALVFLGVSKVVISMVFGSPSLTGPAQKYSFKKNFSLMNLTPLFLILLLLILGMWIPASLDSLIIAATQQMGGL